MICSWCQSIWDGRRGGLSSWMDGGSTSDSPLPMIQKPCFAPVGDMRVLCKVVDRRYLGLDRVHRVGKLKTRSDCPWLEQRLSAQHKTQGRASHTSVDIHLCAQWSDEMRHLRKKQNKIPEDSEYNQGPSLFPCGYLSICLHTDGIFQRTEAREALCVERNRQEI